MHTREQNQLMAGLRTRARQITSLNEEYQQDKRLRRMLCDTLRWFKAQGNPESAAGIIETIHWQLHRMKPHMVRVLKHMNEMHRVQRAEKLAWRRSLRTPMFDTAARFGVNEKEVRKLIIDICNLKIRLDHRQPSQKEIARFVQTAMSYWNPRDGSFKVFVNKALSVERGRFDHAVRLMSRKSIKVDRSRTRLKSQIEALGLEND